MYTDLIYDFDGTISNTYPIFTEALLTLLNNHGLTDTYEGAYRTLKESVGYALKCYEWDAPYKQIHKEFHVIHEALALEKQEMIEGADIVLRTAVEQGKRNFLYTHTGALAGRLLEKMGIAQYFTYVMDGRAKFERKPCPDALNWLMDTQGINRESAIMIGDRPMDIGAGHNAGIHACLFDIEELFPETEAEHHIEKLTDILEFM
jgi:phosphoglycolate phosphatase-like HAD superfamily hydrolase